MKESEIKISKKISQREIINNISKDLKMPIHKVRSVIDDLEFYIFDYFMDVTEDTPVYINLFSGLQLMSIYSPSKDMINNITGERIKSKDKIRLKSRVSREYRDMLTQAYFEKKEQNN